jgi:hypothetical protein
MGTIPEPSVLKSPKHWRGLHTQGLLRQNTLQATKGVHPAFGKGREQEQSMAGGHARRRRPGDGGPPSDWTPYQQHCLLTFHGTRRAPWRSLRSVAEGRTVHLSDDTNWFFTASQADILAPISSLQHAGLCLCLRRVRNHVAHSRVHADEMPTQQY